MTTNVKLVNLTRKTVRIGTTKLAGIGVAAPSVVTVDIQALGRNGRHNLMELLASGSVIPAASTSSVKMTLIAAGHRSGGRLGKTNLVPTAQVTVNLTTLTRAARRDLIQLLASGSLLVGDTASTASVTLYNLSSKVVRIGPTISIPPLRKAGTFRAVQTITLTNETTSAGFKLTYNAVQGSTVFVNGTNCTTAALQTALRTATTDVGLAVTGTANTGPFVVTYTDGFIPKTLAVTSASKVQVITLVGDSGTRQFKLTYNAIEGATAFVRGTNQASSDLQTALRTATSDTGLVVSGATDGGPFTLVFSAGFAPLSDVTVSSATSGLTAITTDPNLSGSVAVAGAAPASAQITDSTSLTPSQRRDLQLMLSSGEIVPGA